MRDMRNKVRQQIGSKVLHQVDGVVWNQVWKKISDQVWIQVCNQQSAQVKKNVKSNRRNVRNGLSCFLVPSLIEIEDMQIAYSASFIQFSLAC